MTVAKVRLGGVWVDANEAGKAQLGGAWVDFGPSGGATEETLVWPFIPQNPDSFDGAGSNYGMGAQFRLVTAGKNYLGVNWRVPDHVIDPGAPAVSHRQQLWRVSDGAKLADEAITPTPGGPQAFPLAAPVALVLGEDYVSAVYTAYYSYSTPSPSSAWAVTSPSGNVVHDATRLVTTNSPPSSFSGWATPNLWFYVAPIVEV